MHAISLALFTVGRHPSTWSSPIAVRDHSHDGRVGLYVVGNAGLDECVDFPLVNSAPHPKRASFFSLSGVRQNFGAAHQVANTRLTHWRKSCNTLSFSLSTICLSVTSTAASPSSACPDITTAPLQITFFSIFFLFSYFSRWACVSIFGESYNSNVSYSIK